VPVEKIATLYNVLDLERVKVRPDLKRSDVLAMFGLPAKKRFVTIVANLNHAVKDHPTFLRAAARVRAKIPDTGFIIAGEGKLRPSLRDVAARIGLADDVFFIGRCERVAELLFASDVCALSSTAEGFSNAILEYMAAARPVVVTDVGGAREAVVDGETGYIVAAGDDEKMAGRIIRLLGDPDRAYAMGERGRQRVLEHFSCQRSLDNTLRLYEKSLGNTSSAEGTKLHAGIAEEVRRVGIGVKDSWG